MRFYVAPAVGLFAYSNSVGFVFFRSKLLKNIFNPFESYPRVKQFTRCSEPIRQNPSEWKDLYRWLRELDGVRTYLLEGKSEFFYRCPAFAMSA